MHSTGVSISPVLGRISTHSLWQQKLSPLPGESSQRPFLSFTASKPPTQRPSPPWESFSQIIPIGSRLSKTLKEKFWADPLLGTLVGSSTSTHTPVTSPQPSGPVPYGLYGSGGMVKS